MTPGGQACPPNICLAWARAPKSLAPASEFQFDLRADEQDEQAKKPDAEKSEQGDDP